jgi:hypothetical protein
MALRRIQMDVTAALFTVAVTVGTLSPAAPTANESAPILSATSSIEAVVGSKEIEAETSTVRQLSLTRPTSARPAALLPLYASFAVLQGLDIYTTHSAVARGGVEANPVMQPVASRKLASTAVKAAATAGSIYFIERAWKHNRKGAVVLATVINAAAAAVVAHNTQVAKR